MIERNEVVASALNLVGAPYLWGAKGDIRATIRANQVIGWEHVPRDPLNGRAFALDCSGAFLLPFTKLGALDRRRQWNTDLIWSELAPTNDPLPGDAALYGPSDTDMDHVMMVIARVGDLYVVAGASGGNSRTTTYEIASARRACFKVKASHLYRPGFRGFRSAVPLLATR